MGAIQRKHGIAVAVAAAVLVLGAGGVEAQLTMPGTSTPTPPSAEVLSVTLGTIGPPGTSFPVTVNWRVSSGVPVHLVQRNDVTLELTLSNGTRQTLQDGIIGPPGHGGSGRVTFSVPRPATRGGGDPPAYVAYRARVQVTFLAPVPVVAELNGQIPGGGG